MVAAVYFYRPLPPTDSLRMTAELRYSLRSIAENLAGLESVHVFGGRPSWLSEQVHHHPVRQVLGKHENTWRVWGVIAEACRNGELPDDILIMNDDYFAVRPVDSVPPYVRGTCAEWTAAHHRGAGSEFMPRTVRVLTELGVPASEHLSYEVHAPLPVHAPAFGAAWKRIEPYFAKGRIAKRTTVGGVLGLASSAVRIERDCKIFKSTDTLPDFPWWSTSDEAFQDWRRGASAVIREKYATPCRFEAS